MCLYRIKRKAAFIGTICLDALLSHLWFSWFLDKEKAPTELAEERQIINDLTNVIKQRIALGTQLEDDKHRYCFFGCTAYPMQKKAWILSSLDACYMPFLTTKIIILGNIFIYPIQNETKIGTVYEASFF